MICLRSPFFSPWAIFLSSLEEITFLFLPTKRKAPTLELRIFAPYQLFHIRTLVPFLVSVEGFLSFLGYSIFLFFHNDQMSRGGISPSHFFFSFCWTVTPLARDCPLFFLLMLSIVWEPGTPVYSAIFSVRLWVTSQWPVIDVPFTSSI